MIIYITYVATAFVLAYALSRKSDRKALSFLLIFWLFTQPIFNTVLLLKTPGLGFDLQPNRVLLVLLFPFLFMAAKDNVGRVARAPFEKYIYIYMVLVFISLAVNFGDIRKQSLGAVPLEIMTFLMVLAVVKRHATTAFLESLINAVIMLAVISSLISFIQIFHSDFLKTCPPRIAFGSVVRSSSIFQSEYELGYFQTLAVMIAIVKFKGSFWKLPLILLFSTSIVTTFHRLDILILITCVASYVWFFGKPGQKFASIGATFMAAVLGMVFYSLFGADLAGSEFVEQRLAQDTVTGRFRQYEAILGSLPEIGLFGMGDYTNKAYFLFMKKHDMVYRSATQGDYWHQEAFAVHNGYLEVATLYGGLAMLVFLLLMFSLLWYFKKHINAEFRYAAVPFYAALIWALANISNGVSTFRLHFVLLLAILGGVTIALRSRQQAIQAVNQVTTKVPLI